MGVAVALAACGGGASVDNTPGMGDAGQPAAGTVPAVGAVSGGRAAPLTVFAVTMARSPGPAGIHCAQWLVLGQDRMAYTTAEIREMGDYFAAGMFSGLPPAALLRFVPGGLTEAWPVASSVWQENGAWCDVFLQITNTGARDVQIPRIGFELTGAPQTNNFQYRLPDVCSIEGVTQGAVPDPCGPAYGGGPLDCSLYTVSVELTGSPQPGMHLATPSARRQDGGRCPPIHLQPNASVEVWVRGISRDPDVYQLEPAIAVTLGGTGVTSTLPVPALAGTMTFAAPSQFTCNRLTGQAFEPAWQGAAALDFGARKRDVAFCP